MNHSHGKSIRLCLAFLVLGLCRIIGAAQGGCPTIDSFTAAPVANGPVAFWRLDEATGTVRRDSIGTIDLADSNSVSQVVGKVGAGAGFSMAAGQRLSAPDNSTLRFTSGDFTIAFWVKFNSLETSLIVAKDNAFNNLYERDFQIFMLNGKMSAAIFNNPSPWSSVQSLGTVTAENFGPVSTGVWYFVIFRHDVSAKTYYLSVNNGPENNRVYTGTPSLGTNASFTISGFQSGGNNLLDGAVDALGIWRRSLSSLEIDALYNSGNGLEYPLLNVQWQTTGAVLGDLQLRFPDGSTSLVEPDGQTNWMAPGPGTFTFSLEVIKPACSNSQSVIVTIDPPSPTSTPTPTPTASPTPTPTPTPSPTPTPTPTPTSGADISVSISDSHDPAEQGNVLSYNITVTNQGPNAAINVTVTDTLPASLTFLLASSGCSYGGGIVTCSLGDLNVGASKSVQILVAPKATAAGTTVMNSVSATGAGSDPTVPNTATESTLVATSGTFDPLQIFFDANNNTGFGTTSPIFNDDGVTGVNVGKYFAIDGVTPGAAAYLGLGGYITNPTERVGLLNFYNRAQGGVDGRTATIASYNDGALGKGNLVFATVPNNVGPLARMIIDSQGNVAINRPHAGIGTTLALGGQSINDTTYPLVAYNSQGQAVLILTSGGKLGISSVNFPTESLQVGPSAQFSVNSSGRLLIGAPGEGIILKSPNGLVCSKLTINNSGVLTTAIVTCPNP